MLMGAARLIGRGTARVLAEAGASVMVTALTNRRLETMGRERDIREVGLISLYLVSDASNYIAGEAIYIGGGVSHA